MRFINRQFWLILVVIFTAVLIKSLPAAEKNSILDRPSEHIDTIFHVGLWVEDIDEMLEFLSLVMKYEVVLRAARRAGGERVIISDARGQYIELLSDPGKVEPHPEFLLHPKGRVAGIAHISLWASALPRLKDTLISNGYKILDQIPADFNDGYVNMDGHDYRILFVSGPGAITFELFEVK